MPRSKGRSGRPWQRLRRQIIAAAPVLPGDIGPRCCVCGEPIDVSLSGNHRDGPTVEHRIALTDGGAAVDPTNLGVAHRRCNEAKERLRRKQQGLNTSRAW